MTRKEKRLKKFLDNPTTFKYKIIEQILLDCGFTKVNAEGSHKKFKHSQLNRDVIVPVHVGECKNFYKNYAAKIIKTLCLFE